MGDELAPVVRWELSRLAKLDLLKDAEVICEVEDVKLKERTGTLVVTDLPAHERRRHLAAVDVRLRALRLASLADEAGEQRARQLHEVCGGVAPPLSMVGRLECDSSLVAPTLNSCRSPGS